MRLFRAGFRSLLLGGFLAVSLMAGAADIKETARATAAQSQKAVVTVRLVVKVKMTMRGQGMDEEQKVEAIGTVVDPAGLTVVDSWSIDPTSMMKALMGAAGGQMKVDSEIKETLILLEDGTEVESDVVLKDTDLGLAFVRPRDAARKFDAVTLKSRNNPPQPLDSIFVLGRLGKSGNRAAALGLDTVRAIVKGPRSFYVCDSQSNSNLGCLAYSADGEPLGVYVIKEKQSAAGEEGGGMGLAMLARVNAMKDDVLPVIRPVNDVIEIAEQARKAKAPAKATETPPAKKEAPAAK